MNGCWNDRRCGDGMIGCGKCNVSGEAVDREWCGGGQLLWRQTVRVVQQHEVLLFLAFEQLQGTRSYPINGSWFAGLAMVFVGNVLPIDAHAVDVLPSTKGDRNSGYSSRWIYG